MPKIDAIVLMVFGASILWVLFGQLCHEPFGVCGALCIDGEFDPGSGRTLAACLTHASRATCLRVTERRTGE